MERKYFNFPKCEHGFLQIGQNYSPIPIEGNYSYACCGQNVLLYMVKEDFSVVGLVLKGGYINRIKTSSYDESLLVCVEVWAESHLNDEKFSYELVDVL